MQGRKRGNAESPACGSQHPAGEGGGKSHEKLLGSSIHHPVLPSNPPTRVTTHSSSIPLPWMPTWRGLIQCRYPHAAIPNSANRPRNWTSNPPIPYLLTLQPPAPF